MNDGRRECTDFLDPSLLARIDSLTQLVYQESSVAVEVIDQILSELESISTVNRTQRRNLRTLSVALIELKETLEEDESEQVSSRSEQLADDIFRIRGRTPKYYFLGC